MQGGDIGGGDTRSLFLSPSDRTEWTFSAEENDVILVRVSSGAFDPAVSIQTEEGVKLAENDDVAPGNQMAGLLFRVPKGGKYKAVVTNYKGTAGGAFSLETRLFRTQPLLTNGDVATVLAPNTPWTAFSSELPTGGRFTVHLKGGNPNVSILDPNGRSIRAETFANGSDELWLTFQTELPGNYLFAPRYGGITQAALRPLRILEGKVGTPLALELAKDEVAEVSLGTYPGQIYDLATTLPSQELSLLLYRNAGGMGQLTNLLETDEVPVRQVLFGINPGTAKFLAFGKTGQPTRTTLRIQTLDRPLPEGQAVSDQLVRFRTAIWTFEAKPGEQYQLEPISPTLNLDVALYSPVGQAWYGSATETDPQPSITNLARHAGRYVVVVSGKGTGTYGLKLTKKTPPMLPANLATGEILAGQTHYHRFAGKAGETFTFRLSTKNGETLSVDVAAPNGSSIGQPLAGGIYVVTLPTDGEYTLGLTAPNATSFRLRWQKIGAEG